MLFGMTEYILCH